MNNAGNLITQSNAEQVMLDKLPIKKKIESIIKVKLI